MTDLIIRWQDVRAGDLVLLDDCLITVEKVEVYQSPWGDGTTFPQTNVYHRLAWNGHRVSSERHGDRFTAVRRPGTDLGTHADLPDPVHHTDVFSRIDASQEG